MLHSESETHVPHVKEGLNLHTTDQLGVTREGHGQTSITRGIRHLSSTHHGPALVGYNYLLLSRMISHLWTGELRGDKEESKLLQDEVDNATGTVRGCLTL